MPPAKHARRALAPLLLLAALPTALLAQSPANTGPGTSAPAWSVGSSRAVIDSAEIATAAASTLSELLQAHAASVSVMMTGGTLRESGTVRVRGLNSFAPDALPILIVDGDRVDETQEEAFGSASRLDDVPLADIARIEILRGAAATTLYGAGAAPGVVVVTTKGGGDTWRWRARGESVLRSDVASYPTNYHRTGTLTASGLPTSDCSLVRVGSGVCTPTGLEQWNPLEAASPFRTGAAFGTGAELSGGSGATSARLSLDSRRAEGITRDDEASRLGARLGVTRRFGSAVEASVRGAVGRDWSVPSRAGDVVTLGLTHMASPDSAAAFAERVDSLVAGDVPHDMVERTTLGIGLRAQLRAWLSADVRVARDRVDTHAEQLMTGVFAGTHMLGVESRTLGSLRGALTARHRAPFGATGVATLGTERVRREQKQSLSFTTGSSGSSGQSLHRLYHNDGWFGEERLTWGDRAALGLGARYELDEMVSDRWHAHPAIDGSYLLARSLGGAAIRARAAYGEVAQHAQPVFYPIFPAPTSTSKPPIEQVRETEGGIDASWGTRATLSLTGYQAVTHDATFVLLLYTGTPILTRTRLRNRGVEVDGRVRAAEWSHGWWELRGVVATLSNRVAASDGPPMYLVNGKVVAKGEPAYGAYDRPFTWSDANSDGIIERSEVVPGSATVVRGSAMPTLEAALHSTLALGERIALGVVVDRRSGFYIDNTDRVRCGASGTCRAVQDPATSLDDQALAVAQRYHGAGWMEDGSFTRLRELWLRWRVPPSLASRLGAADATLLVGARDVALWSDSKAPDPETSDLPRGEVLRYPTGAAPLPRQLMVRVEIGYGAGR